MPRPGKSNDLLRQLEARLQGMSPGERFPPVRQLMREYRLSQSPVQEALDRLVAQGRLDREPGRGMYVRGEAPLRRSLAMLSPEWPSAAIHEAAQLVERQGAERGYLVRRSTYSVHENVYAKLRSIRADGVVIDPVGSGDIAPEQQALLLNSPLPVVMIRSRFHCQQLNWVSGHDAMIGMMAASHLRERGHQRVGILISEPLVPTIREIVEGFIHQARQGGREPTIIDCRTQIGTYGPAVAYRCMQEWLATHRLDFSALFVTGDETVLAAYKAFGEWGIRVPDQVSVMGFGNLPAGALYTPALSTIHTPIADIVSGALDLLDEWFASGKNPQRQINIYPRVVERESIRSLTPTAAVAV